MRAVAAALAALFALHACALACASPTAYFQSLARKTQERAGTSLAAAAAEPIFDANLLTAKLNLVVGNEGKQRRAVDPTPQCHTLNCKPQNAACEDLRTCAVCDPPLQKCFVNAITNSTIVDRETAMCDCFSSYYACLDATSPSCQQRYFLCSFYYTEVIRPYVNSSWDCATCKPIPPTYNYEVCQLGLYCPNSSNTCQPRVPEGGSCEYEDPYFNQCGPPPTSRTLFDGLDYVCNNESRCELARAWRKPRDECLSDAECTSNNCQGGVCVGLAAQARCVHTDQCSFGAFCSNATGTCVAQGTEGAACIPGSALSMSDAGQVEDDGNPCRTGLVCLTTTNQCGPIFSQLAGAACTFNDECSFGLYCSPQGCATPAAAPTPCDPLNPGTTCNAVGGECECDPFGTGAFACHPDDIVLPSSCASIVNQTVSCQTTHQCKDVSGAEGSCFWKNCPDEFRCVWECYVPIFQSAFGDCFDFAAQNPGRCPSSTSTTVTAGSGTSGVGVLAPAVALLFGGLLIVFVF